MSMGCLSFVLLELAATCGWPYTMSPERRRGPWREGSALGLGCGGFFGILGIGGAGQWAPREGKRLGLLRNNLLIFLYPSKEAKLI